MKKVALMVVAALSTPALGTAVVSTVSPATVYAEVVGIPAGEILIFDVTGRMELNASEFINSENGNDTGLVQVEPNIYVVKDNGTSIAAYERYKAERDSAAPGVTKKPVYRLYNSSLQVHLYTTDSNEVTVLRGRGWTYEGISQKTEKTAGEPVYRMYNEGVKVHLYTKDANEYKVLANRGWRQEGIAYRSKGTVPVYRLYNAGLRKHLYTIDKNEYNVLSTRGWKQEGAAWYSQPFGGGKG